MKSLLTSFLMAGLAILPIQTNAANKNKSTPQHNIIQRVLLVSIDGMHALDFINCANGIPGVNNGTPYCPNIAALGRTGTNYLNASTSKPSDSFPGLMALVTGGSPRSVGAFYDVAYDRSLAPPKVTTGNGVAGGPCGSVQRATGTTTEFDEGIDIDQTQAQRRRAHGDGGINSIDPDRLERDPKQGCAPVYPWNFVRTNTIFGVIHGAGGYTAWSDKHPSYSAVSGPGNGTNVDDYYSPEINSTVDRFAGSPRPLGMPCSPIPDPSQTGAWTNSFKNIQCYDTLKVNAILNEINGKTHNGQAQRSGADAVRHELPSRQRGPEADRDRASAPAAILTLRERRPPSCCSEIQFVDPSIGEWVTALRNQGLLDSTLIIITAKHGQSPIDPNRFFPIPGPSGNNGTSPANLIANLLPWSESPPNPTGIGPTEDDVSLLWLTSSTQTDERRGHLGSQRDDGRLRPDLLWPIDHDDVQLRRESAHGDPRTPDIIVTPNYGVVYTGSSAKLSEHGGFSHDDTNVMMVLSNPSFQPSTVNTPVETMQVAPTFCMRWDSNRASCNRYSRKERRYCPPSSSNHVDDVARKNGVPEYWDAVFVFGFVFAYFAATVAGSPTRLATLNVSLCCFLSASTTT